MTARHHAGPWASLALMLVALPMPVTATAQELAPAPVAADSRNEDEAILPIGRDRYFPAGMLANDDFRESWFGNQLAAMHEPVLSTLPGTGERNRYVLRVTFLPSFHPAYAVRIDARGARPTVRMTRLTGTGGYDPGRIATTRAVTVRRDHADTLAALARTSGLDHASPRPELSEVNEETGVQEIIVCTDGMNIVAELVDENGYHLFERHTCNLSLRHQDALVAAATIAAPLPDYLHFYL